MESLASGTTIITKLYVKTIINTIINNGFVTKCFLHGLAIEKASKVIMYIIFENKNKALF
jgi:hypothetical protein